MTQEKKAQFFRDQSEEDLDATYQDLRKQLFDLVNERKQAMPFKQPHRIKSTKKEIARLLTVKSERQRAQG